MIYLASPYSHDDPTVREQRYKTVCKAAGYIMAQGHAVFSPIAHTHGICLEMGGENFSFEFWEKYDKEMINLCDEFWICQMEDWEKSKGIKAELAYAMSIGKPIKYF